MSQRRYKIESVIGQGGFGRVYSAVLEADGGFRKRVAVKVLSPKTDTNLPNMMERFRDEARILGLVQDRAFVGVEPPVQLNGRWTVVMDLAEGESARALMRHGGFPPGCALEVAQELARALSTAYTRPGPDGRPLRLLHRDLKPGNLQISSSGEVRLLDFGIAKARFDEREAKTTNDWAGTAGYSAPERLHGQEGPEGDVFSLGVVLHVLITRDTPLGAGQYKPKNDRTPEMEPAIALAAEMTELDPARRPRMREVEARCRELLRTIAGPTLREWAEQHVENGRGEKKDRRCGETWVEGPGDDELGDPDPISDFRSDIRSDIRSRSDVRTDSRTDRRKQTDNRILPYTMSRTSTATPLRERLKDEVALPKYADASELEKEAERKLAAEKEAERIAMEADRRRYEEIANRKPTATERATDLLGSPLGIAAAVGALVALCATVVVVYGTFTVHGARWGAEAARDAYLEDITARTPDLRQALVSMGEPADELDRHLDAYRAARDPAAKAARADALVTWSEGRVAALRPSTVAAHRLDASVAQAATAELAGDRALLRDATAEWAAAASGTAGSMAVALRLASAP